MNLPLAAPLTFLATLLLQGDAIGQVQLLPMDGDASDHFGCSVSLGSGLGLVGAFGG